MNTIRQQQDQFISDLSMFDNWTERFNYLISESEFLPAECPSAMLPYRVEGCLSKTCFCADIDGDYLRVNGWSNSAVMGGIIISVMKMFNTAKPGSQADIDFHIRSGLMDNLSPVRRASLEEIVRRIENVLF